MSLPDPTADARAADAPMTDSRVADTPTNDAPMTAAGTADTPPADVPTGGVEGAPPVVVPRPAAEPVGEPVQAREVTPPAMPAAPARRPASRGEVARTANQPAHRGAASRPYNDVLHRVLKPPVRLVLNRLVMQVTREGLDNVPAGEPLIFAGNHSSWMDGPLVVIESPRTIRCLTKSEMYVGVLGPLLHLVGQIPVDRGRPDRVALHTALDELSRGGAIGVFPEGTRGSGELAAVQHGIAYLAVHGRCRVLPVACIGTGRALPRGARWPKRSVPVRVVFGAPFAVETPANPRSRKALAAVAEDIRIRLAEHLAAARGGPGS
jgi:1-acyl-sn-glycerol-3-phosphate acyltransferase